MTLSWNFLTNPLARFSRNHANSRLFWRLKEPLRKLFTPRRNSPIEDWIWLDRFDGDLKIQINRNAYLGSLLYWHGGHAQEESAYFKLFLKPGMVVVDAGANFGELTLIAAKQVGPTGHVYSFEPVPSIFQVLNRNIVANGFNHVHAQNTGLHEAPGKLQIYEANGVDAAGENNEGLGTFFPTPLRSKPAGEVPLETLDEFVKTHEITRLDLLKVDVEGSEWCLFQGARNTLNRFKPCLVFELNRETCVASGHSPEALLQMLESFGYQFFKLDGSTPLPDPLPDMINVLGKPRKASTPPLGA